MKVYKALVAAALVIAIAGCADLDTGGKTADSGDTKDTVASSTTLTEDNFAELIGTAQRKAKTSHVAMTIGGTGQNVKAEGDVITGATPAESALSMKLDLGELSGSQAMEVRLVEEVFYLTMGDMADNKFTRIDLNDESNTLAEQYGDMMDQIDPGKSLEMIGDAVKSFKAKGDAMDIDGIHAQPFQLVIDSAKLGEIGGGASGGDTAVVPKEITMTMFMGEDNLPRRVMTEFSGFTMQMDYSKWGEPVKIEAPSAGEITNKSPLDQLAPAV